MKKYTLPTLIVASLVLCSCGDKDAEAAQELVKQEEAKQLNLESLAKDALKEKIAAATGDFLLATPSHFEMSGPDYSITVQEGSGMILAMVDWKWVSKSDLYESKDYLQTQAGEVITITKSLDAGETTTYSAKAVLVANDTGVELQRLMTKPTMDFEPSEEGFSRYGAPRKRFKKSVIVGSDEYMAVIKEVKLLKDEKAEIERIAQEKIEAELRAKAEIERVAKEKIDAEQRALRIETAEKLLDALSKEGSFRGFLVREDGKEFDVGMKVSNIRNVADQVGATMTMWSVRSNGKTAKPATFEGLFNEKGILVFKRTLSGQAYEGPRFISRSDLQGAVTFTLGGHIDKIKISTVDSADNKLQGVLIRR